MSKRDCDKPEYRCTPGPLARQEPAPTPERPATEEGEELTDFFRKEFGRYLRLYESKCAQLSRFIERKNAIESELASLREENERLKAGTVQWISKEALDKIAGLEAEVAKWKKSADESWEDAENAEAELASLREDYAKVRELSQKRGMEATRLRELLANAEELMAAHVRRLHGPKALECQHDYEPDTCMIELSCDKCGVDANVGSALARLRSGKEEGKG